MPTIAVKTAGMTRMVGLLPLDWDARSGRLYLEIPELSKDLLYMHSLPYGTGSNDLGLDRGQVSEGAIVRFERIGPKVLLVEPNEAFRSSSDDENERLAVKQSFPESVLWGFKVEAEDAGGAVLVDATDFFVRDAHGVAEVLAGAKQGAYRLDATRSSIALDATKAFPKNTEVEAILTFTTDDPSKAEFVGNVSPDPHAMTVRERQSLIELPGPGFTPRKFDPRAGYFPESYRDYTTPLGESLDKQFIIRHRLVKKDPNCTHACEAVAPIQYYVDRGAPEPLRTALVEGARWWDEAYQAAGWAKGTFRVDLLPADADPMDVRYNIIQWVHRYTRGWSYGDAVVDPRTGEIIKGNVTLGSLRSRQDYLIAEGLLAPYLDGKALPAASDPMLKMVVARTRQLAAHETGHTLGLEHNFAASSFAHAPSETVSVMDYPFPYVALDAKGVPDLSESYGVGIGAWDKTAIEYGYREFDSGGKPVEDEAGLSRILADSEKSGVVLITDEDARPMGGAHPHAHLCDGGARGGAGAVWRECDQEWDSDGATGRYAGAALPDASLPDGSGGEGDWRARLPVPVARRRADESGDCGAGGTEQGDQGGAGYAGSGDADAAGVALEDFAAAADGVAADAREFSVGDGADVRSDCGSGVGCGFDAEWIAESGAGFAAGAVPHARFGLAVTAGIVGSHLDGDREPARGRAHDVVRGGADRGVSRPRGDACTCSESGSVEPGTGDCAVAYFGFEEAVDGGGSAHGYGGGHSSRGAD